MDRKIKETVSYLRRNQTKAEKVFWDLVRNRRLAGKKFVRQHPIVFEYYGEKRFFVADFYCHDSKLVVEMDGEIHDKQKDYDTLRDYIINKLGISVVRISNSEIELNSEKAIQKLTEYIF